MSWVNNLPSGGGDIAGKTTITQTVAQTGININNGLSLDLFTINGTGFLTEVQVKITGGSNPDQIGVEIIPDGGNTLAFYFNLSSARFVSESSPGDGFLVSSTTSNTSTFRINSPVNFKKQAIIRLKNMGNGTNATGLLIIATYVALVR